MGQVDHARLTRTVAGMQRLLRILDLFSLDQAVLSPERMMQATQASRASIYRDLKQLTEAGLVERVSDRAYALGPRIVELDRLIRLADPLLQAAADLPHHLARDAGGTVLLCRLHSNTVLCILEARSDGNGPTVSYERGRAMPLYRGATSKAILAHLPPRRLEELIESDRDAIADAGLPQDAQALYQALAPLREQGYVVAREEVDRNVTGLGVALLAGNRLLGSLSVVLPTNKPAATAQARALSLLRSSARRIEARMERHSREPQP